MHPLLARQLKRALGGSADIAALPAPWQQFTTAVDEAYLTFDADRAMIERSMEIASQELLERNQQLQLKNRELELAEQNVRRSRDELEQRVAERTSALRAAMEAAEAANCAKSAFLANMSHEIRTPMTAILGYADMLLAQNQSQENRLEYIQTIRQQGEHLLAILNDILDLSKIEANKLQVERIACDPCQIVNETISLMRVRASEKKLQCEVSFLGLLPQTIQTDPIRLRQILLNLLGNALKFTEAGGVQVVVSLDPARPENEALLRFEIIDTGIGLSTEQIAGLFTPFAQADTSTTRKFGGTGLGLTICRRLAQMLHGDISVTSGLGCGSRFVFTIGVGDLTHTKLVFRTREAMYGDPSPSRADSTGSGNDGTTAPALVGRVLIADDGVHNQRVFQFYLETCGLEVSIADNGRIACDRATEALHSGHPFAAILMDMQMPELDGYNATGRLRGNGYAGPIIAVTAHAMSGDRDKCLAAGCTDYLSKPIEPGELMAMMSKYLPARQSIALRSANKLTDLPSISSTQVDPDFQKMLQKYVAALPEFVQQLCSSMTGADVENLRQVLHRLKGTGAMYGFRQITDLAKEAEKRLIETGAIDLATGEVRALIDMIQRIEGFDLHSGTEVPLPVSASDAI